MMVTVVFFNLLYFITYLKIKAVAFKYRIFVIL